VSNLSANEGLQPTPQSIGDSRWSGKDQAHRCFAARLSPRDARRSAPRIGELRSTPTVAVRRYAPPINRWSFTGLRPASPPLGGYASSACSTPSPGVNLNSPLGRETIRMKLQTKVLGGVAGILLVLLVYANIRFQSLAIGAQADRVIVEKSSRRLTLLHQGKVLKVYHVALGHTPVGRKECEGDGRTPEGLYRIDLHKSDSAFHLALHISYPNASDVEVARAKGCSPGGAIMIHGTRNGLGWLGRLHRLVDWTAGCIAVTNWEIEEIWRAVPVGTPIEIRP
jgi:hypothetical protein